MEVADETMVIDGRPAGLARSGGADVVSESADAPVSLARPEVLVAIAVAMGLMLRLLQYGANRSLWLDEVLMLPTIVQPTFLELLNPGRWNHLAPGFLFLEKLAATTLGQGELALRLVPLLAAIAALFVFMRIARDFVTPRAAPIAVGLFALSPFLIYYSSELKPYALDVAVTTLLLLVVGVLHHRGVTPARAALLGGAGILAATFSLPSVFVSAGAAIALLAAAWRAGDRAGAGALAAVLAAWGVLFGAPYLMFVHGSGTNEYAREFWRSGFMPLPPRSLAELAWFPESFFQVFRDPLGVFSDQQSASGVFAATAGMVSFAVGVVWMARNRPERLWILVAPILLALLASGLELYPFGGSRVAAGRVLLFLVPLFFLVMAEGAAQLFELFRGRARVVPLAVLGLMFVPSIVWGLVAVPVTRTEIKPLLSYLEEEARPGDVLYVHYDIRHAFEHYSPAYQLGEMRYVRGVCARGEPAGYLDSLARLQGEPRVWILFADGKGAGFFDERAISIGYLEHAGQRLDDQVSFGASLYLYDLSGAGGGAAPYRVDLPVVPLSVADGCALWN